MPPQNLRVISNTIQNSTKIIELEWDRSESSSGYSIYISISGQFQKLESVLSNKALLKVPSDFVSFKTAVTSFNSRGESGRSNEIEIEGKKEEVELIIPTNSSTQIPTPTPTVQITQKESLNDFVVEEKPETNEDIIMEKAKNLWITPTPTESVSNKSPQQNKLFSLLASILKKILDILE